MPTEYKFTIYVLCDPETEAIRYVGITRFELSERLTEHVKESNYHQKSHRHKWIRSLFKRGLRPLIRKIDETDEKHRNERERHWIAELGKTCNLVNGTEGGEGLINPSLEVRKRISESLKINGYKGGRALPHSEEGKKNISNGMRNSKVFMDAIRNRKSRLGVKFSLEHRHKISIAKTEYWAKMRVLKNEAQLDLGI